MEPPGRHAAMFDNLVKLELEETTFLQKVAFVDPNMGPLVARALNGRDLHQLGHDERNALSESMKANAVMFGMDDAVVDRLVKMHEDEYLVGQLNSALQLPPRRDLGVIMDECIVYWPIYDEEAAPAEAAEEAAAAKAAEEAAAAEGSSAGLVGTEEASTVEEFTTAVVGGGGGGTRSATPYHRGGPRIEHRWQQLGRRAQEQHQRRALAARRAVLSPRRDRPARGQSN